MDNDLKNMSYAELVEEILRLRNTLRQLRDNDGHDLCWYNPEVWNVLPEKLQPAPKIPEWCEFMTRCAEFRKKFDLQTGQE